MSSESKHTPGPWFAHPHIIRDHGARKPLFSDGLWVVKFHPEMNALAVVDYADDHDPATRESAEANARLIAAAPDLYEALQGAIGALEFSQDYHRDLGNEDQAFAADRLDAARAALAKASSTLPAQQTDEAGS